MATAAIFVSTSGQPIIVGTPLGHQRFLNGRLVAVEPVLIDYLRENEGRYGEWREVTQGSSPDECGKPIGSSGTFCQTARVEGRDACMAHDSPDGNPVQAAAAGAAGNLREALSKVESAGDRDTSGVPDAEMDMMTDQEREQSVAYLEGHDPFFNAVKRGAR